MLTKCQIIVFHTIKHSDNGVVVKGFSNKSGKSTYYFYVGKKHSNNNLIAPLNIIDAVVYNRHSSQTAIGMPVIKELNNAYKLQTIREDIRKTSIALYISELLQKSIKEIEPNSELYNFLVKSILLLDSLENGIENFHLYFTVQYCKQLGYMPINNYSEERQYFNFETAMFCNNFNDLMCLDIEQSKLLNRMLSLQLYNLNQIKCSGRFRGEFLKRLLDYISFHIGSKIDLKSICVLGEIFN